MWVCEGESVCACVCESVSEKEDPKSLCITIITRHHRHHLFNQYRYTGGGGGLANPISSVQLFKDMHAKVTSSSAVGSGSKFSNRLALGGP